VRTTKACNRRRAFLGQIFACYVSTADLLPLLNDVRHRLCSELIKRENRTLARMDTQPRRLARSSATSRWKCTEEQRLSLDSVIEPGSTIYLRKVANLSAGGVSIDATPTVHPDNIILAQDIAQHFRLTCLGIDVIAKSRQILSPVILASSKSMLHPASLCILTLPLVKVSMCPHISLIPF